MGQYTERCRKTGEEQLDWKAADAFDATIGQPHVAGYNRINLCGLAAGIELESAHTAACVALRRYCCGAISRAPWVSGGRRDRATPRSQVAADQADECTAQAQADGLL